MLFFFVISIYILQGWTSTAEYRDKKEEKDKEDVVKLFEEPKGLLTNLDLNPFRSYIKGKHSPHKKFQGLVALGKKLLTLTLLHHLQMMNKKIMNKIMS